MRTIVHLSDLHFGRADPGILPPLLQAVREAGPDLVVVSGDFTQRARVWEFKAAARFLAELPGPLLLVPGNHDVPLYDVLRRWLAPLRRYRRYITADLAPFHADAEIAVLGVNTARALTFKNGRISREQMDGVAARLAGCPPEVVRVVVTHHPFDVPPPQHAEEAAHDVVGRADLAMRAFLRSGVDMVLSGHLHLSRIGQTGQRYPMPGRAALLIQAGTATSTRRRGEVNAFNVVRISRPQVTVTCMVWDPGRLAFTADQTERFVEAETGWSRAAN